MSPTKHIFRSSVYLLIFLLLPRWFSLLTSCAPNFYLILNVRSVSVFYYIYQTSHTCLA
jgi:hypothetical protein